MVRVTRSKSVSKDNGEKFEETNSKTQSNLCESDRLVIMLEFPGVSYINFSLSEANVAKIGSLLDLSMTSSENLNKPNQNTVS